MNTTVAVSEKLTTEGKRVYVASKRHNKRADRLDRLIDGEGWASDIFRWLGRSTTPNVLEISLVGIPVLAAVTVVIKSYIPLWAAMSIGATTVAVALIAYWFARRYARKNRFWDRRNHAAAELSFFERNVSDYSADSALVVRTLNWYAANRSAPRASDLAMCLVGVHHSALSLPEAQRDETIAVLTTLAGDLPTNEDGIEKMLESMVKIKHSVADLLIRERNRAKEARQLSANDEPAVKMANSLIDYLESDLNNSEAVTA